MSKKPIRIFGHTILQSEAGKPSISLCVEHDVSSPEDELYISMLAMSGYNIPYVKVQAISGSEHMDFVVPPSMRIDGYRVEAKIKGEEERQLFVASCQYMADMFSQLGDAVISYGEYGASVPSVTPQKKAAMDEEGEGEGDPDSDNILVFKR